MVNLPHKIVAPFALLALSACAPEFTQPIPLGKGGAAVRHNISAQIINPVPPGDVVTPVDATRTGLAVTAYRTGEVKDPIEAAEKSTTTDVE